MVSYDWIVIGGGLTGAALGYELVRLGFSVMLLERYPIMENATRYSYGGIPYWSGTSELTKQLAQEGIELQRNLSAVLEFDTEFRELDLLLTIAAENPQEIFAQYAQCAIQPQVLSVAEACELEPLLDSEAIAGALHYRHGHVNPQLLVDGYLSAFARMGGKIRFEAVKSLTDHQVITATSTYNAGRVAVCAGGLTRSLLKASGIAVKQYFTHAEVLETLPSQDLKLRTIMMPATMSRFQLESETSQVDRIWDQSGHELLPPAVDAGAIQFQNGRLIIGQMSRILTDPNIKPDRKSSETAIRDQVRKILPAIADLSGQWHHCLVAFSPDSLPLVGVLPNFSNVHLFSGFTTPFVFVPPLAKRFAESLLGKPDPLISQLSPARFDLK
jgi:glycine/D-amino acid oxidase-like deaminating enzyme